MKTYMICIVCITNRVHHTKSDMKYSLMHVIYLIAHRPFHLLCDVKHAILRHIIRVFFFFHIKTYIWNWKHNIAIFSWFWFVACISYMCMLWKKRILQVQIIEKQTKMAASMEHEKKENKVIKSVPKQSNEKRLIVVLERASLESVKVCNV